MTDKSSYVTSFCNFAHRMRDGKPIAHECYVLPPLALSLERDGDYRAAQEAIQAGKKHMVYGERSLVPHRGLRCA